MTATRSTKFHGPALLHIDQIEWPNGAGYTPCTREYADAIDDRAGAHAAWQEAASDHRHPEYAERYEAWQRAESAVLHLQAAGHLGRGIRYA